jgi:hypothetical protein
LEDEVDFFDIEHSFVAELLENTLFWPIATEQLLFLLHNNLVETYDWIEDKLLEEYKTADENWYNIKEIIRLDLYVAYTLDRIKAMKNNNLICSGCDEWHLFLNPENAVPTKEIKKIKYEEQCVELPESKMKWLLFLCLSSWNTLYLCKGWPSDRLCTSIIDKDHIWYVQSWGISLINMDTIFISLIRKLYEDKKISKRLFDKFRELLEKKTDKAIKYTNFMNDVYQVQYLWNDCKNVELYWKVSDGEPDYLEIKIHTKEKDYSKLKDTIWLHGEITTKYADGKVVGLEVTKKYKYWKRKKK